MIAKVARDRGDAASSIEATSLRATVDAVVVADDELTTGAAMAEIRGIEPKVGALQAKLGIERYAAPLVPKWARFLTWTIPAVTVLFGAVIWIQIRRRKRALSEADMAALEEQR